MSTLQDDIAEQGIGAEPTFVLGAVQADEGVVDGLLFPDIQILQVWGDDIFCTNPKIIARAMEDNIANATLIKLNQIGTMTETITATRLAQYHGWGDFVSHRSGETTDDVIADLTVALDTGHLKSGAPARGERVAKYNQLLRIEEELGTAASFAGKHALL